MTPLGATIIGIIADKAMLQPETLTPDCALADLGLDSLAMVEAIFAIEEAFDITIPFKTQYGSGQDGGVHEAGDGVGFDLTTIATLIAGVEGLLAQKAA